jgi:hypothetical protein
VGDRGLNGKDLLWEGDGEERKVTRLSAGKKFHSDNKVNVRKWQKRRAQIILDLIFLDEVG